MLSTLLRSLRTPKHPKRSSRLCKSHYRPEFECLERRELYSASIVEHTIPTSGSGAIDITRGPDGDLWFAEELASKVARITPNGTITEYSVTGGVVDLWAGQGDDLWFTEMSANLVGKIDTDTGQVTEYAVPTSGAGPNGITLGADGNMWFAEYSVGKIGVITSAGQIIEYTVGGNPTDLALGSDGNVWFTSYNTNQVGKITTAGVATLYTAPSGTGPAGIAAGADGNLWVTGYNSGEILKVTTSGVFTEYSIPTANSHPWAINAGPGGTLWFAESSGNKIGRVTTSGQFYEYTIPTANSDPRGVVAAADGSIWWTEYAGNKVGRLALTSPSLTLSVSYGSGRMVTLSGQVTDDDPGGLTVTFTGKVVGSVVTNSTGAFNATFEASGLGDVLATVINRHGLTSSAASVTLTSSTPSIANFLATEGANNQWTFTGTVTDESAAGLSIIFGGLASLIGQSTTVQQNGTFSLTIQLQVGEQGQASVKTTDWWGLESEQVFAVVS